MGMNDPNNQGTPPGMPYQGGQGAPSGPPAYGGPGGPPQYGGPGGPPQYGGPGGPGGPPPMMPYQGGQPPQGRRPWVMPLAIIGGIILLVCIVCLGITIVAALNSDDATPTVAAANPPTSTLAAQSPARTPTARASAAGASAPVGAVTPTAAPIVISGCGGASIRNPSSQVSKDIDQWNRIVKSANEITRAWNAFNDAAIFDYDKAVGNQQVVALADAFLAAAEKNMAAIRAETTSGRFAKMAALEIANAEAQVAFVTPYRTAVANSDEDAWNLAVDKSDALDTSQEALEAEVDNQCAYWRSV